MYCVCYWRGGTFFTFSLLGLMWGDYTFYINQPYFLINIVDSRHLLDFEVRSDVMTFFLNDSSTEFICRLNKAIQCDGIVRHGMLEINHSCHHKSRMLLLAWSRYPQWNTGLKIVLKKEESFSFIAKAHVTWWGTVFHSLLMFMKDKWFWIEINLLHKFIVFL